MWYLQMHEARMAGFKPLYFYAFHKAPLSPRPCFGFRLTLLCLHSMQHNLIRQLWGIEGVALAPVVANGIREDRAVPVESGRGDRATDIRITFEAVFGILVPEVEGAVAAGCAESTVDWVEGYGVDGVDVGDFLRVWGDVAVAFEGEIGAKATSGWISRAVGKGGLEGFPTWRPFLRHTG